MRRVLIIYNNIEVLKDFTELLKSKEFVLQCISINGATLISALEFHPDIIIVEGNGDDKSESFLRKLISKKFLFKATINVYSCIPEKIKPPEGIDLIHDIKQLQTTL